MSTLYRIAFLPARPEKLHGNVTEVEQDVIVPEWVADIGREGLVH